MYRKHGWTFLDEEKYTCISDRLKGLDLALTNAFPNVSQQLCTKHLINNIKVQAAKFRENLPERLIWALQSSETAVAYEDHLKAIEENLPKTFDYIRGIPPEKFVRCFLAQQCASTYGIKCSFVEQENARGLVSAQLVWRI